MRAFTLQEIFTGTYANIGIDIWIKFTSHFKEAEINFLERMKNNVMTALKLFNRI